MRHVSNRAQIDINIISYSHFGKYEFIKTLLIDVFLKGGWNVIFAKR